ncbi:MAG: NTP transferase domain-containing protein [Ignavibacteria bacterium]
MDNLTGLIICGGQSRRMGSDKSLLDYYGSPHSQYLFQLLEKFCTQVYLSLNESQSRNTDGTRAHITDAEEYSDIGPMSALLSAWQKFPSESLLVVGCDYPFVSEGEIKRLIQNRKGLATCFINPGKNIYEPLLTVYESAFHSIAMQNYLKQNYSLSKILENENVNLIYPSSSFTLRNANTKDEYFAAKKMINQNLTDL